MISFQCPACQLKLKVQDQFAGRQSKCPTCKKPLTVPDLDKTQAYDLPQQIAGEESNLAKIGHDGGVTLEQDPAGRRPSAGLRPQRSVGKVLAGRKQSKERYVVESEIARGGMGAVMRAVDVDLRREVAVKYLLNQHDPTKKARFVEEAQINAQLEHPNIVPVYDLRLDAQARPYLLMKLVRGRDLKSVLDQLRESPKQAEKEWTLSRLLNILVNVCNGLEFAHAHGVVHRDLKPANIMLGDFGEVYVMDWGLAKVLKSEGAAHRASGPPVALAGATSITGKKGNKVQTSREPEADLTQEGSVLGTPVYMPPEQASGSTDAVDQRSDVYALGAILYEMLTLQPPIDKEGGYLAILMRVMMGEIVPPEQCAPQRARAGKIPRELAAMAMKALAKDPAQRYANVGALRQDLERFREGKSVSAKEDTFKEMAWKLLKRNKGASLTAAAALVLVTVLVGFFLKVNYEALLEADTERNNAKEAYRAYQVQVKASVPVLLRAAQGAVNDRQYDDALTYASIAVKSAPELAEARLLKGKLLITRHRYAEALTELEEHQKLKGPDPAVQALAQLCRTAQSSDEAAALTFADQFAQRQEHALADGVLSSYGQNALGARQRLLEVYRKRIEAAWPGQGQRLGLGVQGQLVLGLDKVTDLTPLKGIPLGTLQLAKNDQIRDLEPLRGMPLTSLDLLDCHQVRDLAPLTGMPLQSLRLTRCPQVKDVKALKGMPLTYLDLENTQVRDLEPLRGMPLTSLGLLNCRVHSLDPLKGMPLASIDMRSTGVQDLQPLKGLPLNYLNLNGSGNGRDVSMLKGVPLKSLDLTGWAYLEDLTPLQGAPLANLNLSGCSRCRDLTPLQGLPLKGLALDGTAVTDLRPLQGMALESIQLTPKNITQGLDWLQSLKSLKTIGTGQEAWPAPEFWARHAKGEFKK